MASENDFFPRAFSLNRCHANLTDSATAWDLSSELLIAITASTCDEISSHAIAISASHEPKITGPPQRISFAFSALPLALEFVGHPIHDSLSSTRAC
jgi:hypothetical protein